MPFSLLWSSSSSKSGSSSSPPASSSSKDAAPTSTSTTVTKSIAPATTQNTFLASLSRTLIFLVGMMLKRPSRIFRPSKVSTFAFLQALARRDGRSFSPSGLWHLFRTYGPWSLILPLVPPLVINTTLTTLLFTTHSLLSSLLSHRPFFQRHPDSTPPPSTSSSDPNTPLLQRTLYHHSPSLTTHPTLLAGLAGAGAGIAQSTLALPVQKLVKFLSKIISGPSSSLTKSASSAAASSSASASTLATEILPKNINPPPLKPATPPPTFGLPTSQTFRLPTLSSRRETLAWLRELRSAGPAGSGLFPASLSSAPLEWRGLRKLGFEGWRWGAAKDAVGYGLFFATFDMSRRVALGAREIVERVQGSPLVVPHENAAGGGGGRAWFGLDDKARETEGDKEEDEIWIEGGLGRRGTKLGRLSQASLLVAGGITAGTLFQLSSRPFDATLSLLRSPLYSPSQPSRLRAYLLSHLLHPSSPAKRPAAVRHAGQMVEPMPAIPLIVKTAREKGWGFFFGPQKGEVRSGGEGLLKRFGWKMVQLGPWGAGFLVFAWVGGEV